jgi:hypothetical protein
VGEVVIGFQNTFKFLDVTERNLPQRSHIRSLIISLQKSKETIDVDDKEPLVMKSLEKSIKKKRKK